MPVHPQVALLLEAVAQSPLPTLDKVSAFVARRLYSERCAKVAPQAPEAQIRLLLTPGGVLDTANAALADCCAALRRAFEKVTA